MNRRELLGSAGAVALLPALDAFATMPSRRDEPEFEAALRLGPVHSGAGNHRWAQVVGGSVTGNLLQGVVRSGRLDWHVDPASGAVEVVMNCSVHCMQGRVFELRDRTAHAGADRFAAQPGWPTAPELFEANSGRSITAGPLNGRMDTTDFGRGVVRLRAFHPA